MIELTIRTQLDAESCGPTCLHAVYNYYGLNMDLGEIVSSIEAFPFPSGGTRAPMLGKHALMHGFEAVIYINNLSVFDPSWFKRGEANSDELSAKLIAQLKHKDEHALVQLSLNYLEYLKLGGKVRFKTLNAQLLQKYFQQKTPIITGLSATYLYGSAREIFTKEGAVVFNEIEGIPRGHFVVLCGYDSKKKHVVVADPHRENPLSNNNFYKVEIIRLVNAILLGVRTYDGNLLIIKPRASE